MLVLTRKSNEAIKIGDNIEVTVLAIEGDQIKLGIDAPKSVAIHRKEVYLDIQQQNNEAANVALDLIEMLPDHYKDE